MNFLMDTNITVDAYLKRQPWDLEAGEIVKLHLSGKVTGFIPASSITDLFYILRKQAGKKDAMDFIKLILQNFEICSVDESTLIAALGMPGSDFEDNVQIACAIQHQLDCIVTRDQSGFIYSPIPVLTPAEFLARLKVP